MIYLYVTDHVTTYISSGAFLAQKFWGEGTAPINPFITESIFSVLRNQKNELHIGLHLKSIVNRVAKSVMG